MVIISKKLGLFVTIGWTVFSAAFAADVESLAANRLRGSNRASLPDSQNNRDLQKTLQKPPSARDDVTKTPVNTAVTIAVLENDGDAEGDTLTVMSHTKPSHGTAEMNTDDGTITYTPNTDFVGSDSFFYTNTDGNGGFGVGRVIVNVLSPPNTNPEASDVVDITTTINTAITIPVLDNVVDPDGHHMTILAVTIPSDGKATINEEQGTITYTPNPNFVGIDVFAYLVSDIKGGTDTAVVEVQVIEPSSTTPDAPPVAVDDTAKVVQGETVEISVLDNDSDPNIGEILSVISVGETQHGTTAIDSNQKMILYTPDKTFVGTERFSYTISDGREGGTATAFVSVQVLAANSLPIAEDDTATTSVNTPVVIYVLKNDSDPDNDDELLIAAVDDMGSTGAALINKAKRAVTYLPALDFVGTDTFQYTVEDRHGDTATATVTVEVKGTTTAEARAAP